MSHRHLLIALAAAEPGMTLSDSVLDTKGNVLLPTGTVLTASLLESLQRHQIDSVAIAADGVQPDDEQAERARRMARVERLFRPSGKFSAQDGGDNGAPPVPGHDATGILQDYMLRFRAEGNQ